MIADLGIGGFRISHDIGIWRWKGVNLMAITITKVEKIEATRIHTDPSQAA
jgi:hypothetical protein